MKSNIAIVSALKPSQSTQPPSPIYVYCVGENETFYYEKTDALLTECRRLQPDLAKQFAALPRPVLAMNLARTVDTDLQPALNGPLHESARAAVVLLLDTYVMKNPDFHKHVAAGVNSIVLTAFRKQVGGYVIRLCAGFLEDRCVSIPEVLRIVSSCLLLPHVLQAFDGDGLAQSSVYHEIRRHSMTG